MQHGTEDDLVPTEALDRPADAAAAAVAGDELAPGTRVGRYRVEALLGRGGMGEVYRAGQLEPVRRRVALKLLRDRRLDARHLAWFEIERQLLAQMQHPAIAQIFDAGATPQGHPYFAMEYIEGSPITRYCDERELPLAARIELLARVCDGVQHAHGRGVVHRDLKPGNILVTEVDGRAQPKIIDFGIATAASRSAPGEAGVERAGTPAYMSPEQAGLVDAEVDPRSDVYSLGVVLCELLTGTRPPADGGAQTGTARTTLRPPSVALAQRGEGTVAAVASGRGVSPARLLTALRHELDWVVLKAIRSEPGLRYASAAELAQELRRFLEHRPVLAAPATTRYVAGRFLRRHRVGVAAAAAVAVALVAGLALSLWGLLEAHAQRRIAEARQAELEQVAAFQQAMLEGVDVAALGRSLAMAERVQLERAGLPTEDMAAFGRIAARVNWTDIARDTLRVQMLERALEAVDASFASQPVLASDLRASVAGVLAALGAWEQAADVWQGIVPVRESALGPEHPQTLRALRELGGALIESGHAERATPLLDDAAARAAGVLAADHPERLRIGLQQSRAAYARGELQQALEQQTVLLAQADAAFGEFDELTLEVRGNLAGTQLRLAQFDEGRAHLERIHEHRLAQHGEADARTQAVMSSLARARGMSGDFAGSLALSSRLIDAMSRRLGAAHPQTLGEINTRVVTLIRSGRNEEAAGKLDRLVDSAVRVHGPDHPNTLRYLQNQASLTARIGDHERAAQLQRTLLERRRRVLGAGHPDALLSHISLASILADGGRLAEALPIAVSGCEAMLQAVGEQHRDGHGCLHVVGDLEQRAGRPAAARPWFERALAARSAVDGPLDGRSIETALALATVYAALGESEGLARLEREHFMPLLALPEAGLDPGQRQVREAVLARGDAAP